MDDKKIEQASRKARLAAKESKAKEGKE